MSSSTSGAGTSVQVPGHGGSFLGSLGMATQPPAQAGFKGKAHTLGDSHHSMRILCVSPAAALVCYHYIRNRLPSAHTGVTRKAEKQIAVAARLPETDRAKNMLAQPLDQCLKVMSYLLQAPRQQCRPQLLPQLLQPPVQPGMGSMEQRLLLR